MSLCCARSKSVSVQCRFSNSVASLKGFLCLIYTYISLGIAFFLAENPRMRRLKSKFREVHCREDPGMFDRSATSFL